MRSALEYLGLWEAVSKPPAGALATRSVIEDDEDEVQDVAEDDAASAISSGARPTPPAQTQKARQAHMILMLNIKSQEMLAQLADVPSGNAHEVWTRMHAYYNRNTQANKNQLKTEFFQMKQGKQETVAAYAARLKKVVLLLAALKEKPSTARAMRMRRELGRRRTRPPLDNRLRDARVRLRGELGQQEANDSVPVVGGSGVHGGVDNSAGDPLAAQPARRARLPASNCDGPPLRQPSGHRNCI
jgi:hypothetical protein